MNDEIKLLIALMKEKKPHRFEEFQYSNQTIYHYLDRIQQGQNLYD